MYFGVHNQRIFAMIGGSNPRSGLCVEMAITIPDLASLLSLLKLSHAVPSKLFHFESCVMWK